MTWETWLLYAATDAFAYLVPGPAALFIVSQALARGAGRTSWAILGVLSAEAMYFILSATGLALLLTASYDLFFAIKWLGAAYLVWLGIQAFRGQGSVFAVGRAGKPISRLRSALQGFVMNAANPKVLLFYTAIVPQFVNPHAAIVPQMLLLGVTGLSVGVVISGAYAVMAARMARRLAAPQYAKITNRITGSLLIAAGAGMAALRRS
jgi:homoserine/homoserine lactone efflux protein